MPVSGKLQPDESPEQTQGRSRSGCCSPPRGPAATFVPGPRCHAGSVWNVPPRLSRGLMMLVSRMLPALMGSLALGEASPRSLP